jgi:pimeloyl-ACP methyl ester carboxylesterase
VNRSVAVLAWIAILATGFLMRDWLVGSMLYHPTPGVDLPPERLGISADEVFFETEDGVRLHAFLLPAEGATRALLFLHGNAGNASHRLPNAEALRRQGTHVLLLDYRGYGRSEGRPGESGLYADARAGLAHLTEELGIPERRVIVFGRSLGGAVAVDLAQERALAGLILESTFSSLADIGASHFGRLVAPLVRGRFDSAAKIARVRAPLLFFHGDRDEIIPYDLGRRLFAAASEPKSFETLSGAGHNDTVQVGGRRYFERIRRFLDEVAPDAARTGPTGANT